MENGPHAVTYIDHNKGKDALFVLQDELSIIIWNQVPHKWCIVGIFRHRPIKNTSDFEIKHCTPSVNYFMEMTNITLGIIFSLIV